MRMEVNWDNNVGETGSEEEILNGRQSLRQGTEEESRSRGKQNKTKKYKENKNCTG